MQPEVGDDLIGCLMNRLYQVIVLSTLVDIRLVKVEKFPRDLKLVKGVRLTVIQHIVYFGVHGSSASRDIIYFICHVISQENLIKGSCEFVGWELLTVFHHSDKFSDHRHWDTENTFLICLVTSLNNIFKVLCEFMGENASR